MARHLSLNDLRVIRELAAQGVELDLERARLWPHSALTAALTARLPLGEIGAETFVQHPNTARKQAAGVVQARLRRNRPEADITFIAPALDVHPDAVTIWYRLLAEASNELGEQGVQRIFVQVANGNGAEEVFRQAGFSAYAHEDIYCLPAPRVAAPRRNAQARLLRRQRKRDTWDLLRLYNAVTPRPVQQAEGTMSAEGGERAGKLGDWWDQTRGTGYVLELDSELVGAVRVTRGRAASWLRLYLQPGSQNYADELVHEAVSLVNRVRPRPVYCGVRDYESGIRAALEDAGFELVTRRSLMVKHTTVRIKEPVPALLPILEKPAPIIHARSDARAPSHARERETVHDGYSPSVSTSRRLVDHQPQVATAPRDVPDVAKGELQTA